MVCKNCGSEVSPYVTECPYCGQRVRKRAPKLDRSGDEPKARRSRRRRPAPRLRTEAITGIAPDRRPYGTIGLIVLACVLALVFQARPNLDGVILVPGGEDAWRWFVAPFVFLDRLGYAFVALLATGIFGTMLERRFGPLAVVATFVLAGGAGFALVGLVETPPLFGQDPVYAAFGANGSALGLLCAWLVEDRRAARRGVERGNDLLGAYVVGSVLVLLSLAEAEANIGAAVGGAAAGAVLGLVLALFARREAR